MQKENHGADLPMGFTMALAQNPEAMRVFSDLSEKEQQEILSRTHSVSSRAEMRALVQSISEQNK